MRNIATPLLFAKSVLIRSRAVSGRILYSTFMTSKEEEKLKNVRRRVLDPNEGSYKFIDIDRERNSLTLQYRGLVFNDFDIYGRPKIWNLLNILHMGRYYGHHYILDQSGTTFRDFLKMSEDRFTFMITSQVDCTKALYVSDLNKSNLLIRISGGYVGNTSLNTITDLLSEKEEVLLMRNITQVVSVDKENRRPFPLPEWWRVKYGGKSRSKKPLKFRPFHVPEDVHFDTRKIVWSDLDAYKHTNWVKYVQFCVDSGHLLSTRGLLHGNQDNLDRDVKTLELTYHGESYLNDTLDVHVWEDVMDACALYFQMLRDNNVIFKAKFMYH